MKERKKFELTVLLAVLVAVVLVFNSCAGGVSGNGDPFVPPEPEINPREFLMENIENPEDSELDPQFTEENGKLRNVYGIAKIQIKTSEFDWIEVIHVGGNAVSQIEPGQLGTIWLWGEGNPTPPQKSPEEILAEKMDGEPVFEANSNYPAGFAGISREEIRKGDFDWINAIHCEGQNLDILPAHATGTVWIKTPTSVLEKAVDGDFIIIDGLKAGRNGLAEQTVKLSDYEWIDAIHHNGQSVSQLAEGEWGTVWIKPDKR